MIRVEQMDALGFCRGLEDGSVDLVVSDPAYPSLEEYRAVGTTTRLTKEWFPVVSNEYLEELIAELFRVLAPDAHCYLMADWRTTHGVFYPAAAQAGFTSWPPIVWDKCRIGMGYHYRQQHEFISFFEKGKRKLNNLSIPSILSVPRVSRQHAYPTEKPTALLRLLIEQSSEPGDTVLDPFAGSGATLLAARDTGRRALGCDISDASIDHMQRRGLV